MVYAHEITTKRKWRFYTRNLHFSVDKTTHCVYNMIKVKERRKAHEWVNMIRKKTRDYNIIAGLVSGLVLLLVDKYLL